MTTETLLIGIFCHGHFGASRTSQLTTTPYPRFNHQSRLTRISDPDPAAYSGGLGNIDATMSISGRRFSINKVDGSRPRNFSANKSHEPSEAEQKSKVHREFREAHEGHRPHAGLDPTRGSTYVPPDSGLNRGSDQWLNDHEPVVWYGLPSEHTNTASSKIPARGPIWARVRPRRTMIFQDASSDRPASRSVLHPENMDLREGSSR